MPSNSHRGTAGRLLAALDGNVGTRYVYDAFDRLLAREPVTRDPVTQEFSSGGNVVMHLWSGWSQVGEYEVDAADPHAQPEFTWTEGPESVTGLRFNRDGGSRKLFRDHQGSVKTKWEDSPGYDAFGNVVEGTLDIPRGFQDQEWRAESDLYYMRNRWYDPESARFLSRDPVVQDDLANYAFVRNSPVMLGDPMGLLPERLVALLDAIPDPTTRVLLVMSLLQHCTRGQAGALFAQTVPLVRGVVPEAAARLMPGSTWDLGSGPAGFTFGEYSDREIGIADRVLAGDDYLGGLGVVPGGTDEYYVKLGTTGRKSPYRTPPGGSTRYDALVVTIGHELYHLQTTGPAGEWTGWVPSSAQDLGADSHAWGDLIGAAGLRALYACDCP